MSDVETVPTPVMPDFDPKSYYGYLWESIVATYGPNALTDEQIRALSEEEADKLCDLLDILDDQMHETTGHIELDYNIYGWHEEEWDDAQMVRTAFSAGIQAAFLLAQELKLPGAVA
jgi:hypothetical protein